ASTVKLSTGRKLDYARTTKLGRLSTVKLLAGRRLAVKLLDWSTLLPTVTLLNCGRSTVKLVYGRTLDCKLLTCPGLSSVNCLLVEARPGTARWSDSRLETAQLVGLSTVKRLH
ncbi:hypothetical protein L9F63_014552, partial [Diploptera punctata]